MQSLSALAQGISFRPVSGDRTILAPDAIRLAHPLSLGRRPDKSPSISGSWTVHWVVTV